MKPIDVSEVDVLILEAKFEAQDRFIEELLAKGGDCMRTIHNLRDMVHEAYTVISEIEDRLDALACFENPDEGNIVRILEWMHKECPWLEKEEES